MFLIEGTACVKIPKGERACRALKEFKEVSKITFSVLFLRIRAAYIIFFFFYFLFLPSYSAQREGSRERKSRGSFRVGMQETKVAPPQHPKCSDVKNVM